MPPILEGCPPETFANVAGREVRGREKECRALERLVQSARSGSSGVLVIRGAAGMGKTALLEHAVRSSAGLRCLPVGGVESEMELPFAALHQLCSPLLPGLARLPGPQRAALETVFGLADAGPPERFLVGLALLSLLSDAASNQPLLCAVDDFQWLDQASAQALSFVARRLEADPVAMVFTTRVAGEPDDLARLPELVLEGLAAPDATQLLLSAVQGRLDDRVVTRAVAEAHGNPLALLELARGSSPGDIAGGFGVTGAPLSGQIEQSFQRRAGSLPPETQTLLLLAASDPVGDAGLLWRAAAALGVQEDAALPAEDEGLVEFEGVVRFRHPLVRSAVYKSASAQQRRQVHAALAEATDAEADPDRRAWHSAQATIGTNETVARELERSADRAQARGGLAATAAFLERAVVLTPDRALKTERALAAAEAKCEAGAPGSALELLALIDESEADELTVARVERLRGRVAHLKGRPNEGAQLLLSAAKRLEPLDPALARKTLLAALDEAIVSGARSGLLEVASEMPRLSQSNEPQPLELLLAGWSQLITDGFPAGYDLLKQAMHGLQEKPVSHVGDLRVLFFAIQVARGCWDDEQWFQLSSVYVRQARESGALSELPRALSVRVDFMEQAGELAAAAAMLEEANAIADAIGAAPRFGSAYGAAMGADEDAAVAQIEAAYEEASRAGDGDRVLTTQRALAVLYNGLGRYQEALAAAQRFCAVHPRGGTGRILMEMVEAAARSGEADVAVDAFERLRQRTQNGGTDWALGAEACAHAIISEPQAAQALYDEASARLGRCRMKMYLARSELLYGEWLRREHRSVEARQRLRDALEMFNAMGARPFAKRAQAELLATGGRAPKTKHQPSSGLTAQEARVAALASEGLTNQQVAAKLFLSANTVDYHLRKVFQKLNINNRNQLHRALAGQAAGTPGPAAALMYA
ncbi:MAG TPA: AAA family ATPase [Acidimicrobiales bacterium]|nr:AAA family ATPase [Acidimicrobiales bacterium]